tara:strand:+ start:2170 stop:2877 length:708 start_codon:yes stop_codon:yes gene_type:complete
MQNDTTSLLTNSFAQGSTQLSFWEGFTILLLSIISGVFIRYLYSKYSLTYSSKVSFANTLLIVTVSVASIIAIVKASLALSLGLVGALSVIRFRTAVKEPYNLSFLLWSICIGIGIGASQYLFSFMVACTGSLAIILIYKSSQSPHGNLWDQKGDQLDTVSITLPSKSSTSLLYELLEKSVGYYTLLSLDQEEGHEISLTMNIRINDLKELERLRLEVFNVFPGARISFYNATTG